MKMVHTVMGANPLVATRVLEEHPGTGGPATEDSEEEEAVGVVLHLENTPDFLRRSSICVSNTTMEHAARKNAKMNISAALARPQGSLA